MKWMPHAHTGNKCLQMHTHTQTGKAGRGREVGRGWDELEMKIEVQNKALELQRKPDERAKVQLKRKQREKRAQLHCESEIREAEKQLHQMDSLDFVI